LPGISQPTIPQVWFFQFKGKHHKGESGNMGRWQFARDRLGKVAENWGTRGKFYQLHQSQKVQGSYIESFNTFSLEIVDPLLILKSTTLSLGRSDRQEGGGCCGTYSLRQARQPVSSRIPVPRIPFSCDSGRRTCF
jgi:hypothetical protein